GQRDIEPGRHTFRCDLFEPPQGAAGQPHTGLPRSQIDDPEIAPEHAVAKPGAERLRTGFLGGKPPRVAGRAVGAPVAFAALGIGEDAFEKAIAKALHRLLYATDIDQVAADAENHRACLRRRSTARPLDRVDDRGRAQCGDDRRQMLNVGDFDVDHDLEEIRRAIGDLQIADIAALLADYRSQASKVAGLVGDRYIEAADMIGVVVVAPGDIEPALRRFGEALQSLAVDGVDRHPLPGRDESDDAVTGQRVAAAGEVQRHARDETADRYRDVVAFGPAARSIQRDDLGLGLVLLRECRVDDGAPGRKPLPHRYIKILDGCAVESLQHRLERPFRKFLTFLAERLLHDGAPEIEVLRALLRADKAADTGARLAGDDKPLPGRRGRLRLRGDDFDLVAILQLRAQRDQPAVDLDADTGVADLGMHRIGKVDRGGAARQRYQIALRGKGEHLVLKHLELGVLEEFFRPRRMVEDIQELAQPAILRSLGRGSAMLVGPMRGDPELSDIVHLAGADLHLDALLLRPDDPGVQRAVIVRLGS